MSIPQVFQINSKYFGNHQKHTIHLIWKVLNFAFNKKTKTQHSAKWHQTISLSEQFQNIMERSKKPTPFTNIWPITLSGWCRQSIAYEHSFSVMCMRQVGIYDRVFFYASVLLTRLQYRGPLISQKYITNIIKIN